MPGNRLSHFLKDLRELLQSPYLRRLYFQVCQLQQKGRDFLSAPYEQLEKLLKHEDYVQWYGQLMNLPQTIAFFIQLDYWLKHFKIKLI